jgi:aminoglycoside phosphotransferase (APT) family kinase protein
MAGRRMHADEQHTDAAMVRRLVAAQFPKWSRLSVRAVRSAGTDNAVYRLGERMLVRLPRIERAVADVAHEQRWLPRLAPLLPVAIPRPRGLGTPAEGYPWPWSVYGWLEGENPTVAAIADAGSRAAELAAVVRALQAARLPGAPPAGRGVPLARRDGSTRDAIAALSGMIDTDAATAAWRAALAAPEWTGRPVWVHGDLAPGNLLVANGRLTGVIDWAGAGVGDPACDMMVAWNLLPAPDRALFRDAVGADDATWLRGRGWALSVALIQLPYYRRTNPVLAASARHVIGEVLAEHGAG